MKDQAYRMDRTKAVFAIPLAGHRKLLLEPPPGDRRRSVGCRDGSQKKKRGRREEKVEKRLFLF